MAPADEASPGVSPGPGVDRFGTPVVDPTQNVLDLVEAAIKRQDDLRMADRNYLERVRAIDADDEAYRVTPTAGTLG